MEDNPVIRWIRQELRFLTVAIFTADIYVNIFDAGFVLLTKKFWTFGNVENSLLFILLIK